MKPCPYCKREVGDDTNFCWYCNREIESRPERPAEPEKKTPSWIFYGILIVLIIAVLIFMTAR
jgi:predicted amidophosphoribosyltransferase